MRFLHLFSSFPAELHTPPTQCAMVSSCSPTSSGLTLHLSSPCTPWYKPAAVETLEGPLLKTEAYCMMHAKGNQKITVTGPVKVVKHTLLNGAPQG